MARSDMFTTVRSEGAVLPPDLLQRVAEGAKGVDGLTPDAYHLSGERLNEAIARSWTRLVNAWANFRSASGKLPEVDLGTTITRERWLLPLFQEFGYGRLPTTTAIEADGKAFPISHCWQQVPIHLVGCRVDLDRRTAGVAGAARTSPHGLLQELLNRSDRHLWGFVANGLRLRILRDSSSLTRQAYVEFDLETMMDGEAYADFALLWLLCHQSRVEADRPEECWLEKWSRLAQQEGTRALDKLRDGVQQAITALGRGFISYPANADLKSKLRSGELDKQDYYRQLLRVVYRLIFLFVAEDRNALLHPQAALQARERYVRYYSTQRLRRLAERRRGTPHVDLWRGLSLVFEKLGADSGCPELGLPALGSFLWSAEAVPALVGCDIANADLLEAVRALAFTTREKARRPIDYHHLGSEELGSVYESLLELHPDLNLDGGAFALTTAGGSERKTTGSYYTPTSLVRSLLDSALDPVLDEAARKPDAEAAILDLKVCDPACGSGHFLVAAAHRMARRLAAVRTGDDEPSPEAVRTALRDIIGRCVYGVDINPMSVELCKVSLWMEALEPGRPLSFLDHHIQCGNSLIGATPALLKRGIPDEAFTPIEGDDKDVCREYKKLNKEQRKQFALFTTDLQPWEQLGNLAAAMVNLDEIADDSIGGVRRKQQRYEDLVSSQGYMYGHLLADAWCAAFAWKKTREFAYPITEQIFRRIEHNPHHIEPWMRAETDRLRKQYGFFHWHLAFPDVFRVPGKDEKPDNEQAGWSGGFDCVLGNPPWERVKLQEKEWFAERNPEIANAPNAAARKRLIEALTAEDPALYRQFLDDSRKAEGESHLMRNSGRYPLCGRGDINVYTVFAEGMRTLLNDRGRVGGVLPSGIATDDTTKLFFQDVVERKSLASLFDFENKGIFFPGVHSSYKFCLFTSGRGVRPTAEAAELVFFAHAVEDLRDPERCFTLSAEDITLLNPNTHTCPIFRSRRDAELTKAIYRRVPVLIREAQGGRPEENPWGITFNRMFDMSNDSHLFRTREQLEADGWRLQGNIFRKDGAEYLPLYEAKMTNLFDHRHGSIVGAADVAELSGIPAEATSLEEHQNPCHFALPRYWVPEEDVERVLAQTGWDRGFMINTRDVARGTDVRTAIQAVIPAVGVGHKAPLILPMNATAGEPAMLLSALNAFALDFIVRQKIGGASLSYFIIKQLPIFPSTTYAHPCPWSNDSQILRNWLLPRVLELSYTAWDLESFARDCGWSGPPFRWDEERRFLLRCELDAAFFHLYLAAEPSGDWQPTEDETPEELARLKSSFPTPRDAASYIMDTFPIVKRKDEAKFEGEYRTKRVILEIYDALADCIRTGQPYQTRLDPPPADPRCCHPPRE